MKPYWYRNTLWCSFGLMVQNENLCG